MEDGIAEFAPTVVDVAGLTRAYGTNRAVDGVDLQVEQGEVFALRVRYSKWSGWPPSSAAASSRCPAANGGGWPTLEDIYLELIAEADATTGSAPDEVTDGAHGAGTPSATKNSREAAV